MSLRPRFAFAAILGMAVALRLGTALWLPSIVWPDEIFQVQEQAHRIVFGTGIVPWEFLVGVRSWFFPGVIAGVLEVSRWFGEGPQVSHVAVCAFMTLTSLAPVVCGWLWGERLGGAPVAITVGAVNAVWVDLVYFAPHTLNEVIAANSLVVALYLAAPDDTSAVSRRRLAWAGIFFGVTAMLRFQLAPALGVAALWTCGRDIRKCWLPLVGGALPVIAIFGTLDYLTLGYPFQSIWLNFWVNIELGASRVFGVHPWYTYPGLGILLWGGAVPVILLLTLLGARRLPVLLLVAAAVVVTHSFLPHKELRFIYPALPLVTTLFGIGTGEVCAALARRTNTVWARPASILLGVGFWAMTSLALAVTPYYRALWLESSGMMAIFARISTTAAACGVALLDDLDFNATPGQASLPRDVAIYAVPAQDLADQASAFNFVLRTEGLPVADPAFTERGCYDNGYGLRTLQAKPRICVWTRAGRCTPAPALAPRALWPNQAVEAWAIRTGRVSAPMTR